jgi:hypothetical protein
LPLEASVVIFQLLNSKGIAPRRLNDDCHYFGVPGDGYAALRVADWPIERTEPGG